MNIVSTRESVHASTDVHRALTSNASNHNNASGTSAIMLSKSATDRSCQ
jgi:hypothetical protein